MNARMRLLPTPLAIALSLAFAGSGETAPTLRGAEAPSPSLHYALHMSQRAQRNAMRFPAHGAFRSVPHARGNALPVTSCADDGSEGTLRSVIASAAEGDIVDLGALDCSTITLTQGIIDVSVLGDHHVNDLSIAGPGAALLTIDGNGDRVFAHGDFQVGLGTLSISDLTIANGNYTHGLASCIDSSGNIALTRAVVTGCDASGGGPLTFGGAVSAAYLTMTDSEISYSNTAAAGDNVAIGGGAYVSGDATLVRSAITGNTARAETPGDGTYYLTAGGGLYVRGALSMSASAISHDRLYTNDLLQGPGGGAFVRADTDIVASTFSWNIAPSGGGLTKAVFSHYGDPGTTLSIANSTFGINGASSSGGAIETFRPTTIANSTVYSNGSFFGGALFGRGSAVTIELESTIIAKNAYNDVPGYYLDIYCEEDVTVEGANNLVIEALHAALPADTIQADPLFRACRPTTAARPRRSRSTRPVPRSTGATTSPDSISISAAKDSRAVPVRAPISARSKCRWRRPTPSSRTASTDAASARSVLLVEPPRQRLRQHARLALAPHLRFERIGGGRKLVAELQVVLPALGIEPAVRQRRAHGATGLALMAAIAEAALLRERFDVGELAFGKVFLAGQLDLAHAGRIDQAATGRQHDQRAVRRRVAAAAVVLAHGVRRLARFAEQRIRQRRLADAGRADQHGGIAGPEIFQQRRDAFRRFRVDRNDLDLRRHARAQRRDRRVADARCDRLSSARRPALRRFR